MDASENFRERRLSGAVLPDEAVDLTAAELEVDISENGLPTECHAEVLRFNERRLIIRSATARLRHRIFCGS